ncbi:ATP-binding cassette domain-containing protein [Paractinoplanes ferrugineus]|uniref:Branched-chain amino acid ABC transporter ATP-binding protein n=1 Tax=Paractinoplanes ferrugineus TaxID=113564 RepID=A0A919MJ01_9ACTN|nr:ATP-binding cassette domain-containing protein [Actinoplanes ferrugineus]GIE14205.1 branched-chain amino acid ABC transporter ATP-binding protein [Actinoplanes ferrugineus]
MSTVLLHLDEISRRYGAVTALHPLSLTIPTGARHAIIGPNGAGKTTLLHLIAGTLAPTEGRIVLNSRPITRLSPAARADLGVGRTFQHPAVVDQLTVADNVALAIRRRLTFAVHQRAGHRALRAARVAAALQQVGLTGEAATLAGQLPYGRRRLLEIAVVLAARPRLLLLDEPSAGLDPAEISHLTAVIRALPAEVTVVLVDHHLPLVFDLADTITVLASGQHVATGGSEQIRNDALVRDAYFADTTPATTRAPRKGARPTVLDIEQLSAGYHGAPVLDQVDLTVSAGTVHALLGLNGAGKSTLINVVAGLHPARAGTRILLDGTDLRASRTARHRVALVPQGRRLWTALTVSEHLAMAAAAGRRFGAGDGPGRDVADILDMLPVLRNKLRRYPAQMSGGEQQMLAIARALLLRPRLLLLDEPSEGLAPQIIDQLTTVITGVANDGVAVLLAEQNQRFARAVADQISVLDSGHIEFTATTAVLARPDAQARLAELLGVSTAGTVA